MPQGKADLLEGTKKKVRALLLSAKNGLLLQEFLSDYRDLIGEPFPYRNIGFPTPESCLQEMKDVVWMQHTRSGQINLHGVADETTQHIAELVSKQRSKRSGGRSHVLPLKTKQAVIAKQRIERQSKLAAPHVPPFIRTNIAQMLKENPGGVLASSFNAIYCRRFGTQIDYNRLRFNNIKELLLSITDIVHIEDMKSGNCQIFAVDMAPVNQRTSSAQSAGQQDTDYIPPPRQGRQSTRDAGHETETRTNQCWSSQELGSTQGGSSNSYSELDHSKPPSDKGAEEASPTQENAHDRRRHHKDKPVYADGISNDVKTKLQAALKRRKSGMFSRRLQQEFKDLHNEELSFQRFGYTSIIEFVSALPDIVAIERPNPKGDWVLYDAETHQPQKPDQQQKGAQNKTTTELEKRLVKLLNAYPNGLLLGMLPYVYKQTYGETLIPENYNFVSLDAMVRSFADRILKLLYKGYENGILYPYKSAAVPPVTQEPSREPAPVPPRPSHHGQHRRIPADVVFSGVTYVKQRIPKNPEYLEVFVSNVNHPGRIWVQLKGVPTTDALEEMMDQLEEVYCGNEGDLYRTPEEYLTVGMPCAAIFHEDQNWHRCTITAVPENQEFVEVYFIDYGNSCNVHKNAISFLKSKFMKLPAQALEARLANITMANGKYWTDASKNFLLKLVANKPLMAYVTEVKYDQMSLCLCDTNGQEDVHINDLLIEECHAKFHPDNMTPEAYTELEDLTLQKGFDYTAVDSVSNVEALADDMQYLEVESSQRYVKFVHLTLMFDVHLINYENTAYLPGTEISAFFWDTNRLRAVLRTKKMKVPSKVVCQNDDPELFEEFKHFRVKGLMDGDEVVPYTTIYELAHVPQILDALKHPSLELKNSIKDLIDKFNPDDLYWKGEESVISNDESEHESLSIRLEDLNLLLKAMQFRRHRLLQNMANVQTFSETAVDEVNEVEIQINAVQEKIKSISDGKDEKQTKVGGETAHVVRADSDEFIQTCLDNFQEGGGDTKPVKKGKDWISTNSQPETKPQTTNVNRVAPFVDTSVKTATCKVSAPTTSRSSSSSTAQETAALSAWNVGLPLTSQVGISPSGMPIPSQSTTYGISTVSQATVGVPGLSLMPLNQGLLTAQQQQQILASASVIQAQGAALSQLSMPTMGTTRGVAPCLMPPMMNMPGVPNMMNFFMPPLQPLGRGQPNNIAPRNLFSPGTNGHNSM